MTGSQLTFPDDVDVAVVSHNGRGTLPRLLAHLVRAGAPTERIAVYDIGSTDETDIWLRREWPRVTVRRLDGNVGPNPARNWALRDATHAFLLLLDADAYLQPDAPARLREALDRSNRVGIVTPVVVHANSPGVIQYASVGLHFLCEAANPWLDRPLAERGIERRAIGTAPGVALLIDVAAAVEIGLWDERYFMGKDDGDFCYRMRMAGYLLIEEPRAIAEHGSRPRSAWMFKYQIRNRWYFMLKNYDARTLIVLLPALCVHEVAQVALLTANGHLGSWWHALGELVSWGPALRIERRSAQRSRLVHDRALLEATPLLVRPDLVGGGMGRAVKKAYDAWLRMYWGVASRLLA